MIFNLSKKWLLVACGAVVVVGVVVVLAVLRPWEAELPATGFRTAAVAANGYECAQIGRDILEKNGSAADAAIAAMFCEGISCAQCMGLGGGFLLTFYDASNRTVYSLNAREVAPAAATQDMFQNASATVGGLAVAVPAELRGYGELHRRFGRLPWAELVRPAADLCRTGHVVTEYMARALQTTRDIVLNEPSLREVYVNPATGDVYGEGDLVVRPMLARTLEIIAEEGPDALHSGSLTELLVNDIRQFGGIITVEDMNSYRPIWQEPVSLNLSSEYTLYTVPLPGSGSVLSFILNMLNGWVGTPEAPSESALYYHRIIEAFKYAYAKRSGLGDPPRPNMFYSLEELVANMTNPDWARSFRQLVDDAATNNDWRHYGAMFEPVQDAGTAHVSVIAPDGSAVSATSTINLIFGSKRRSQSTGIILNNEMDDFALPEVTSTYGMPPSPANMVEAGKRPLSSMVPVIVLEQGQVQPKLVIGAAGGTKITTQVAMIVQQTLMEGDDFQTAIWRPRLHHQLLPMAIEYEHDFDQNTMDALMQKGHALSQLSPTAGFAAVVGTLRDSNGYLLPQTDKRRIGSIAGF